jgi:hypothetical protein
MGRIVCPGSGVTYHETTDNYHPRELPNGSMFRLTEPYRTEYGWSSFPELEYITDAGIECPNCGIPYLQDGRIILDGKHTYSKKFLNEKHAEALTANEQFDAQAQRRKDEEAERLRLEEIENQKRLELSKKVVELYNDGHGLDPAEITKVTGLIRQQVNRIIKNHNLTGA